MRKNFIYQLLAFITITLLSANLTAEQYEPINHLKEIAKTFVIKNTGIDQGESIEVLVNQSNTLIQVPACGKIIDAGFPQNYNKEQVTSVELTCAGPISWHVMMPVEVQIFSNVLIAKRTLTPKEVIKEEDVDFTVTNKNRLYSGYFKQKEEVVGKEAAHLLPAGTVLTQKNIKSPVLIHRNQAVNIISTSNAVTVTMQGVAKSDGALNEMIKVFNPSSKKTLDAMVIGQNKAQVAL